MTMVPSPTKVIVWFDLSASGTAQGPFAVLLQDGELVLAENADVFAQEYDQVTGFFTLDDPIKGQLDSTDYVLAGDVAQDITADVQGVTINRGRPSLIFPEVPAGRWVVTLNNEDRTFDPFYAESAYLGNIVPGKRIQVRTGNVTVCDGFIEDWNLFYAPNGQSTAQIVAIDALAILAGSQLESFTTTAQTSGARVNAILDRPEVAYGTNRSVDAGVVDLQADTISENTNVLNYLQTVTATEYGNLYASRTGTLTFKSRDARFAALSDVVLADDGTGIPYVGLDVQYGSETLFNRITLQRVGGTAQTVTDAASIDAYRARTYSRTDLLNLNDNDVLELANLILDETKDPNLRIARVVIDLARLSTTERDLVLAADITDVIEVRFTPNGIGDPIAQWAVIEGVDHQITPASHRVTFTLGFNLPVGPIFLLDDPVYGRLDLNVLGF